SPRNFFRFHDFEPRNFFVPRTHFIDGPGGSMTATVRRQHRVYFEVEIEREKGSEIDRDRGWRGGSWRRPGSPGTER
ncbi:hypothetical protein, partial [Streptosporangium minutum]